jgi:predicted nuclease with TOPRIM domain
MDNEINKNMNISDLAIMVANGFSEMDKKFKAMDEKFYKMDERFDAIDDRLDSTDSKLEKLVNVVYGINDTVIDMNGRLKKLEEVIEPLMMGFRITQKEIQDINLRVDRIERKTGIKQQ